MPASDFVAWRDATSLERLVAYDQFEGRVSASGMTATARIATVSDDFWAMAGVKPILGHVPTAGASQVLLSHAFFERQFAAHADVLGTTVMVGGRQATIAGVLPPSFHVDLVRPPSFAGLTPGEIEIYHAIVVRPPAVGRIQLVRVVGQLKPGVSIDTARTELQTMHARVEAATNPGYARQALRVVPLRDKLVGDARRSLLILFAAVVVMLLVACANIANLLLARASARQKELAIRAAVGAGRGRMLRQLLVESVLLALAGGLAGLLIAQGGLQVMLRLIPQAVPRLTGAALDGRVLVFALVVSLATALLFGVGPALFLWNTDARDVLKDGARRGSATARGRRARNWLVTVELALTLVLLCGAGLLVKSLWRVTAYPSGFAPARTLTATVQFDAGGSAASDAQRRDYVAEVLRRLQPVAGLDAVGMTTNASGRMRLFVEGTPPDVPDRPVVLRSSVSQGYAAAIGIRLVAGRWLTDSEPLPVFVINESLARRYFPGEDAIGKRIQVGGPPGSSAAAGAIFAPVVGVIADFKYSSLDLPTEPEIFADYRHASPFTINIVARISGDPWTAAPTIRALIAGVDKSQRVSDVTTIKQVLTASVAPRRLTVFLFSTFAAGALLLALIGIYGVTAYAVALRTREIGVRMAFGAQRRDVMRTTMRDGLVTVIVGLLLGIAAALVMTRAMTGLLYEVAPTDPATFAVVCGVLGVTVLGACGSAALKAANVDPLIALRYE